MYQFTTRDSSCGKVVFSQVSGCSRRRVGISGPRSLRGEGGGRGAAGISDAWSLWWGKGRGLGIPGGSYFRGICIQVDNARIHGFQSALTDLEGFASSRVHARRADKYRVNVQTEVLIRDLR